jgi:uracil-DNA glycosylase
MTTSSTTTEASGIRTASDIVREADPGRNCARCPRLRRFILDMRKQQPDWFNAPVPTWYPADGPISVKLFIIGMAPGMKGANRTGRAFTGDMSGALLFSTLLRHGLAEGSFANDARDELDLVRTAVGNAVRCVPPENRPTGVETANCRPFLQNTLARMPNLKAVVTLGKIAHDSTIRSLGERLVDHPFAHGAVSTVGKVRIFSSYHCSRYNVNTRRLTPEMFDRVFAQVADYCDG